jgi:hypothetical protein
MGKSARADGRKEGDVEDSDDAASNSRAAVVRWTTIRRADVERKPDSWARTRRRSTIHERTDASDRRRDPVTAVVGLYWNKNGPARPPIWVNRATVAARRCCVTNAQPTIHPAGGTRRGLRGSNCGIADPPTLGAFCLPRSLTRPSPHHPTIDEHARIAQTHTPGDTDIVYCAPNCTSTIALPSDTCTHCTAPIANWGTEVFCRSTR